MLHPLMDLVRFSNTWLRSKLPHCDGVSRLRQLLQWQVRRKNGQPGSKHQLVSKLLTALMPGTSARQLLLEQDKRLQQLHVLFQEQQIELRSQRVQLVSRDKTVDKLVCVASEAQSLLGQKEEQIAAQQQQLDLKDKGIAAEQEYTDQLEGDIDAQVEQIAEKDRRLAAQDEELDLLHQKVQAKQCLVQQISTDKQRQLDGKGAALTQAKALCSSLQQEVADKEVHLEWWSGNFAQSLKVVSRLKTRLQSTEEKVGMMAGSRVVSPPHTDLTAALHLPASLVPLHGQTDAESSMARLGSSQSNPLFLEDQGVARDLLAPPASVADISTCEQVSSLISCSNSHALQYVYLQGCEPDYCML